MQLSRLFYLSLLLSVGCDSHPNVNFRTNETPTPGFGLNYLDPNDGAQEFDRGASLLAVFSSELDLDTVDATTVSLTSAGVPVAVSLDTEGPALRLVPAGRLPPLASFELVLSGSIAGINGAALGTGHLISFSTRDVRWGHAAPIADLFGTGASPSVGVDESGDAVAVWSQSDGGTTPFSIRASEYKRVTGTWSPPHLLEIDAGEASMPMVVVDPLGDAIAVWRQVDGTFRSLYGARYVKGTGWSARTILESSNAGDVVDLDVACTSAGVVFVVFTQFDGTRYNAWAKRFVPLAGWSLEQTIELVTDSVSGTVRVSASADGTAVAVWDASDGVRANVWANRYVPGGGWGTAEMIEGDSSDSYGAEVGLDASGNATVVWTSSTGDVWANRRTSAWGAAAVIEQSALPGNYPRIAVAPNGVAIASWTMLDSAYYPWFAEFDPLGGWQPAGELVSVGTNPTTEVLIDKIGRPVVFWHSQDPDGLRYSIWSKRKLPSGWQPATLVEQSNAGTFSVPVTSAGPDGDVIAVWSDSFGSNRIIWAASTE